jgi:hypothetical protein
MSLLVEYFKGSVMHKPLMPLDGENCDGFLSNGVSVDDKHLPTRTNAAAAQ